MGKKYRVKDIQSGRTITFNWNGDTVPTDADLEEVFSQARGNAADATAVAPPAGEQEQPQAQGDPDLLRRLALIPRLFSAFPPPPVQTAEAAGTLLELGLPTLATGLAGPLAIPASGALAGTGTMLREAMVGAAKGKPPTVPELFASGGESALYGMGGELAGRGIAKLGAPLAGYVEPQSLEMAKKLGTKYLPSEVLAEKGIGPATMQGIEGVLGSTLGGGAVIGPLRTGRLEPIRNLLQSELNSLITSLDDPSVVREVSQAGLKGVKRAFDQRAGKLYRQVANLSKQSGVNTGLMKRFATGVLNKIPQAERVAAGAAGSEATALVSQLEAISKLPASIPFEDAQFYRSQLLDLARTAEGPLANRVVGSGKKLSQIFESRMRVAAQQGGFLPEYEAANKFYAAGVKKFENAVIKKLADIEPEKLAAEVVKPRNAQSIFEIRQAIGEDAFNKVKRLGLQDWIDKAITNEADAGQFLDTKKLLSSWRSLGPETKGAAFSAPEQAEITRIFESMSKFSTKAPSVGLWGIGSVATGLTGAGLVGGGGAAGAMLGGIPGAIGGTAVGLGTVTLVPAVLAKLISSNLGRKYLTEGFLVKPGSREAVKFAGRFSSWLAKENTKEVRVTTDRAMSQPTEVSIPDYAGASIQEMRDSLGTYLDQSTIDALSDDDIRAEWDAVFAQPSGQ